MSRKLKNILHYLKPFLWLLSIVVLSTLLSFASKSKYSSKCQEFIDVNINYKNGVYFLDKDDILNMVRFNGNKPIRGSRLSDIKTDSLESLIESNPYVAHANVFFNIQGNLLIDIEQRKPIVRVFNKDNVSYYFDVLQQKIPLSGKFTARVPVLSLLNNKEILPEKINALMRIVSVIQEDEFLSSFTEQLLIDEQKGFEIIPKIGDQIIVLGEAKRIEEKFNHLRLFYRHEALSRGWNRYKEIDLRFKNQIVCTKR